MKLKGIILKLHQYQQLGGSTSELGGGHPAHKESPAFQMLAQKSTLRSNNPCLSPPQLLKLMAALAEVLAWTRGREKLASLDWNPAACTLRAKACLRDVALSKTGGSQGLRGWQECLCKHTVLLRTECPQHLERK